MKGILAAAMAALALGLALPAPAGAAELASAKYVFKKDAHLKPKILHCANGRHPLLVAFQADPAKLGKSSMPVTEHFMRDRNSNYVTVGVTEDTDGILAQFCDPRDIKPFYEKLKAAAAR
jgi:hypothetical protein